MTNAQVSRDLHYDCLYRKSLCKYQPVEHVHRLGKDDLLIDGMS